MLACTITVAKNDCAYIVQAIAPNRKIFIGKLILSHYNFKTKVNDEKFPVKILSTRHKINFLTSCLSLDESQLFVFLAPEKSKTWIFSFNFDSNEWCDLDELDFVCGRFITVSDHKIWTFDNGQSDTDTSIYLTWYDMKTKSVGKVTLFSPNDSCAIKDDKIQFHWYQSSVNGIVLQVATTNFGTSVRSDISAINLNTLEIHTIVRNTDTYLVGYGWKVMQVDGTMLTLLGSCLNEQTISHRYSLDLSNFEFFVPKSFEPKYTTPVYNGTMGHDWINFFNKSEACDFEITAVEGTARLQLDHRIRNSSCEVLEKSLPEDITFHLDAQSISTSDFSSSDVTPPSDQTEKVIESESPSLTEYTKSQPIKVHMVALMARWPYFHNKMSNHDKEFHSRRIFVPEPISWVRSLIKFVYQDSLNGCDMEDATGLLVLSKSYDFPSLRRACIEIISKLGINKQNAALVWSRALEAGEDSIRQDAAIQCKNNWAQVVQSKEFQELPVEMVLTLCEECIGKKLKL